MEKVLPCPLLLLVVLAIPSPALAQDCNAADTVVKEGTPHVIKTTLFIQYSAGYDGSLTLFVKPESDFEGVTLYTMTNDATLHTAWFPAEEKCFPRDGKWLQFKAMVWSTGWGLQFHLMSGACWEECYINTDQTIPINLSVVAHGPSRWLSRRPHEHCEINLISNKNRKLTGMCKHSPITPTTPTTNSKWTPGYITTTAVSAAAAVVVVAVVVVVVVFYWKRKAVTSPRQAGLFPPPPDEHVIENDIYQPFDGVVNHAAPQTFHNDLYDSRSAHGHRHDS
ncbi:uncharacterized protein LOC123498017 [Portunus trituberculatus]|uniref:uncharacterized protein LOC123498017 n=1 Tax=Portunus trituberculatus TaxID=210409 RepID=UPI001E1CDF2E|nr:uncharacterized protein LOC123498017 [Portunus trituberculatus]